MVPPKGGSIMRDSHVFSASTKPAQSQGTYPPEGGKRLRLERRQDAARVLEKKRHV